MLKLTFLGFTEERHKEGFLRKGFEEVVENLYKKITENLEVSAVQKKRFGFMEVTITKKEQGIQRTAALEEFPFKLILEEVFPKQVQPDYMEVCIANVDEEYLLKHWTRIDFLPHAWEVKSEGVTLHRDYDNELKKHTYRLCVKNKKEIQFYEEWIEEVIKTTVE